MITLDPLTQFGSLSRDWGTGSPDPAIRADNHTTIYTGKIHIPADADGDGVSNETGVQVKFTVFGDDDTHGYVNGVLVSTDPGGHGRQDAANTHPGITLNEGQVVDFVLLQAEQGGGSGTGLKWALPDGSPSTFIPVDALEAGPSVPQASTISLDGAATRTRSPSRSMTPPPASSASSCIASWPPSRTAPTSRSTRSASTASSSTTPAPTRARHTATSCADLTSPAAWAWPATRCARRRRPTGHRARSPGVLLQRRLLGRGGDIATPLARQDLQGRMNNIFVGTGENVDSA